MQTATENRRWSKEYPELGTGPVPAESCISPEYFELERERVFRRTWLNVGRVDDIPNAGDFFVRELAVCKTSILVIRGKDGVIRGFHNVCSHRSNKLVWEERGTCRGALACHFHSWGYNAQGQLTGVPDEDNFHDIDKSELGLTPVTTDIWEGFIFVHLGSQPQETLTDYLGGVAEQMKGAAFHKRTHTHTYKVEENANWKVALDAQNEAYHLPFQHRYSFPGMFVLKDNRYLRLSGVKLYNHHAVWSTTYNSESTPTPTGALMNQLNTATTNSRLPMLGDFDFFVIFPNFVILQFRGIEDDYYMTYNFWPLAVDRCIWEIKFHFPPAETAGQRLSQEYLKHRICDVLQEDAVAHETLQTGLTSRAKTHLILQDDEIQIRHFHKVLEDYMGFFNGRGH